jgi:3-hydroxyacyl-[acyl-carrier-protein] dehydratase
MRYLLLDRIVELHPGESIRGVKNVAMSEDVLEFHFPKNPIMPGVLLLESLVQLTGWLEAASSDFSQWFLISRVQKCNFYGFVLPGDQVELEVKILSRSDDGLKVYGATGKVEGKRKIKAQFEGNLVALEDIEDAEEQRRFFKVLRREVDF